MPRLARPQPPLPDDVALAASIFGSEALVALIRHYGQHPGPQRDAVAATGLPHQLVSRCTRQLADAGVLEPIDRTEPTERPYRLNRDRIAALSQALVAYVTPSR